MAEEIWKDQRLIQQKKIFEIDNYFVLLDEDEAEFFHRITARLLFNCKRASYGFIPMHQSEGSK